MIVDRLVLAVPFSIGALVLLISLLQLRSLLGLLESRRHRQYWSAVGLLVGVCFVGYVGTVWISLAWQVELVAPLVATFALLCAFLALLVVTTGEVTIEALVHSRDELERREEEFERLYEVTDVLNRILRHNLRNNMNVILGRSDMIDETVGQAEHVEAIKAEARRLVEIGEKARTIHDTLDSAVEAEIRPVDSFVAPAVETVAAEFSDATVTVDGTADVWIEAGPLFETAVENVLDNAVRHNEGDATVEVGVVTEDDHVRIAIADDGPGIHPYEVEAIRQHRETPLQHGSGLGLWLASWIVDQYGGDVEFADNEPSGTVVTLRLPRGRPPAPPGGSATARTEETPVEAADGTAGD